MMKLKIFKLISDIIHNAANNVQYTKNDASKLISKQQTQEWELKGA